MTETVFVEVKASCLELRICEIAEQIYAQGHRLQIIAASREQAIRLDDLLWTYTPESFLPHGILAAREENTSLPVVITSRQERIPGIQHLLMTGACSPEFLCQFAKAVHFVVVDDRERRAASRRYWVQLREAGFALKHQKLSPRGKMPFP